MSSGTTRLTVTSSMLTTAYSREAGLLLLLYSGTQTSDAEYGQMLAGWEMLHRDATHRAAGGIVIVPKYHPQPNADVRRRLAAVHRTALGPRHVGLVTASAAVRGVITAVSWLVPRGGGSLNAYAFETFDAAVAKFETLFEGSRPVLRALLVEAQKKIHSSEPSAKRAT